ncbi:hypothetical protein EON65_51415 [archaeon]|nr:MAG: hypothetical protein EON65_51415 [archaeon]
MYCFAHCSQEPSKEIYQEFYVIKPSDVSYHLPLLPLGGKDVQLDVDQEDNITNGVGVGLGVRNTSNMHQLLNSFRGFFCRRYIT